MSVKSKLAMGVILAVAVSHCGPFEVSAQLPDNFDTDKTYWDGATVDVSGTVWDGVQGTSEGFVSRIDANQTNSGQLALQITDTASNGTSGSPFDVAALYQDVTGNFDVKVEMPVVPPETAYLSHALGAWNGGDLTQAVHIDNLRGTGNDLRFRDSVGPDEFPLTDGPAQWIRLQRTGNIFTGYFGPDGTNWTKIGDIDRDYGATLRVGVSAWNFNAEPFTAVFDNYMIVPEPSTAMMSLIGLMLLAGGQVWRKRG